MTVNFYYENSYALFNRKTWNATCLFFLFHLLEEDENFYSNMQTKKFSKQENRFSNPLALSKFFTIVFAKK